MVNSIVRTPRRLPMTPYTPRVLFSPRVQSAARIIQTAYRNRKRIRSAVRTGARMYRSAKRRRTSRIRSSVPRSETKPGFLWASTNSSPVQIQRKTLALSYLDMCAPATTVANLMGRTTRNGQFIFLKGFKYCLYAKNVAFNVPTKCHFAVIQPKDWTRDTKTINDIKTDFFSNLGGSSAGENDTMTDFQEFSDSAAYDFTQTCQGINTMRYNILFHKKFILSPTVSGSNTTDASADHMPYHASIKHMNGYIKVNKRFSYENPDDTVAENPLVCCFWHEALEPITGSHFVQVMARTQAYYRNTL